MMAIAARDLALLGARVETIPGRMGFGDCVRASFPHPNAHLPGILVMGTPLIVGTLFGVRTLAGGWAAWQGREGWAGPGGRARGQRAGERRGQGAGCKCGTRREVRRWWDALASFALGSRPYTARPCARPYALLKDDVEVLAGLDEA